MFKKIIMILIPLSAIALYANTAFASLDIAPTLVEQFGQASSQVQATMKKYALNLFALCATLEIAYLGIQAALGRADIGETIKNFVMSLIAAGFFLAVINNYESWSASIIRGLQGIASESIPGNLNSDEPFKNGWSFIKAFWDAIDGIDLFDQAALLLVACIGCIIIIGCSCFIAAKIVLVKCESFIAMAAASILLGLGGTSFFRDYGVNTIKYIFSVGFKLMVLQLVVSIGNQLLANMVAHAEKVDFSLVFSCIGGAIILVALVNTLPDTVAGILSGSQIGQGPSLSGGLGAAKLAFMPAAKIAAGGVSGAAKGAHATFLASKAPGGIVKNLWNARKAAQADQSGKTTIRSALQSRINEHSASQKMGEM